MSRPFPRKIDLLSPIKDLRVEQAPGSWNIWLTANKDWTCGTFIELCSNGSIKRITWHPDGTETVFEVTGDE
jgi:hypothetical protein